MEYKANYAKRSIGEKAEKNRTIKMVKNGNELIPCQIVKEKFQ